MMKSRIGYGYLNRKIADQLKADIRSNGALQYILIYPPFAVDFDGQRSGGVFAFSAGLL
jgi:hypothetical protein